MTISFANRLRPLLRAAPVLLPLLIILGGCRPDAPPGEGTSPSPEPGDTTATAVAQPTEFRRFAYFFRARPARVDPFLKAETVAQLIDEVPALHTAHLYRRDDDHFLVLDGAPDLDAAALAEAIHAAPALDDYRDLAKLLGAELPTPPPPLERIYELDQAADYAPAAGQLKTDPGPHRRFVWTLLLEDDPELIAEYRRVHARGQAWPEITANMKSIGVLDMEIYLHDARAILIMDTEPDFDLEAVTPRWQSLPREAEWQAFVAKFQRTTPGSSIREKWLDMEKVW